VCSAKEPIWSATVLMTLSSDEFVAYTDRSSTGTKMPRTTWREMARFPLTLPSVPTLGQAYERIAAPLIDRIVANVMNHGLWPPPATYSFPSLCPASFASAMSSASSEPSCELPSRNSQTFPSGSDCVARCPGSGVPCG
jgi:hypothetical protein